MFSDAADYFSLGENGTEENVFQYTNDSYFIVESEAVFSYDRFVLF